MKKTLIFLSIFCSIFACKKDNLSENIEIFDCGVCESQNTYAKADKNVPEWGSKEWKAYGVVLKSNLDSTLWNIDFVTGTEDNILRETIDVSWIPQKIGTYNVEYLDDIDKTGKTVFGDYGRHGADGDLILGLYYPNKLKNSTLTITSIDLNAKKVKGSFNLYFKQSETINNISLPQEVNFLNGTFDIKIQ
jgi:hypothetical protein